MSMRFVAQLQGGDPVGLLNLGLTLFVIVSVSLVMLIAAARWVAVMFGMVRPTDKEAITKL